MILPAFDEDTSPKSFFVKIAKFHHQQNHFFLVFDETYFKYCGFHQNNLFISAPFYPSCLRRRIASVVVSITMVPP